MKKRFLFLVFSLVCQLMTVKLFAQNVGIGTTTPTENLHVVGNKALFQTNFFGIGAGNPTSPYTVFQVKRNFNDWVGMYIDAGAAGKPFYGYSLNGVSKAFTIFDGANNQWEYHQTNTAQADFLIQGTSRVVFNTSNLGIGTFNPIARLHVADKDVVFTATGLAPYNTGNPPVSGEGRRTMWYADKAAFRTGYVSDVNWDKDNVGPYSFACGFNSKASNVGAVAMGEQTTATGIDALAVGIITVASGNFAVAMGDGPVASGDAALATGYFTTASGDYSTAIGSWVSTNNHIGALVIGDHSSSANMNSATDNSFRARFTNGYRFFTSSDLTTNALLAGGDNAWSTASDVRIKENFDEIDGESVLHKIAGFHLTSWNYKTQDPKIFRHYGPMAQDFHAAFGQDKYGTIGNDTTINQSDFLGVNFMAIQALEKRTETLIKTNNDQQQKIEMLMAENELLTQRLDKIESLIIIKK